MAHKNLVGGTAYDTKGGKCLVGGTGYAIKKGRTLVGGTGYDVAFGPSLSSLAEGDTVKIKENGTDVSFVIAKHNYESDLNGAGRTLLVRSDSYKDDYWNTSAVNDFAVSSVCNWLNTTYKSLLDAGVQDAIGTTTFYYTPANGNDNVTTLSRSVFLLSYTEAGIFGAYANKEGTELPTAQALQISTACWSRSPRCGRTNMAYYMKSSTGGAYAVNTYTNGIRPIFTLPDTMLINPATNEILP